MNEISSAEELLAKELGIPAKPGNIQKFFQEFEKWPAKAKFLLTDADRFIEFSEIEYPKNYFDDVYEHQLLECIKQFTEEDTNHIKLDFVCKDIPTDDAEALKTYVDFFKLILSCLRQIEKEFSIAHQTLPKIEIVILNSFSKEIGRYNSAYIENQFRFFSQ